ncbi:hypothetical protein B0H15DRAFT_846220 [Mycena belliarum]|uniref:Uncharacterized protein n=1 Tax=Mycena belliarum TaxID=1033014 RepID=A0AAD6U4U1_9AGAR|nr:hypothetical protein B0H15DRAFT_846220 [Mycena belliae]
MSTRSPRKESSTMRRDYILILGGQDASSSCYLDGKPDTPFEKIIQLLNHEAFPSSKLAYVGDLVVYAMFATKARPQSHRAIKADTISGASMTNDEAGILNRAMRDHVPNDKLNFAACQEAAKEISSNLQGSPLVGGADISH